MRLSVRIIPFVLVTTMARADPQSVPEPPGLRQGPMHGVTPVTVSGASVIDAEALAILIDRQHPVLIDVANVSQKPPAGSSTSPWLPGHRSVPGAIWMPGAGAGTANHAFSSAFSARIAALTGGDKTKPVVAFCHPQRWGSWNAAKRMAELGYRHVYWFPGGAEGWQDHRPAAVVQEDAAWTAALHAIASPALGASIR